MTAIGHDNEFPRRRDIRVQQLAEARDNSRVRKLGRVIFSMPEQAAVTAPEPNSYIDDGGTYGEYVQKARESGELPE